MDELDMNAESRQHGAAGIRTALHRLATYGTLAPGRLNDHQLGGLEGRWLEGYVQARLVEAGWGASLGFPAMVLDPDGPAVHVDVFESADLPAHWSRLDDFEGPGYRRVVTTVHTPAGEIDACIYVLRAQDQDHGRSRECDDESHDPGGVSE
jgi:gamma-glutamylcyclotransferase (GGCT)/AIG2-like uncharacterized protein YtfP